MPPIIPPAHGPPPPMLSVIPEMMSDGKRMRPIWRPGDGDGDPSAALVEKSMTLIRGHPTWKLFADEIPVPIIKGQAEPPHFVYLDDKACYDVWSAKAYNNSELRQFWPWDFNHQGNIKQGRKNRGRPAYANAIRTIYAEGSQRGALPKYVFSGAPLVGEYSPVRPLKPTRIEQEVMAENEAKNKGREKRNEKDTPTQATPDESSNTPPESSLTPRKSTSPQIFIKKPNYALSLFAKVSPAKFIGSSGYDPSPLSKPAAPRFDPIKHNQPKRLGPILRKNSALSRKDDEATDEEVAAMFRSSISESINKVQVTTDLSPSPPHDDTNAFLTPEPIASSSSVDKSLKTYTPIQRSKKEPLVVSNSSSSDSPPMFSPPKRSRTLSTNSSPSKRSKTTEKKPLFTDLRTSQLDGGNDNSEEPSNKSNTNFLDDHFNPKIIRQRAILSDDNGEQIISEAQPNTISGNGQSPTIKTRPTQNFPANHISEFETMRFNYEKLERQSKLQQEAAKNAINELHNELEAAKKTIQELKSELETSEATNTMLKTEHTAFRHLTKLQYRQKKQQQIAVKDRKAALQTLSNKLNAYSTGLRTLAVQAEKEIAPTGELAEDMRTVLDLPGKFMYDRGLDEEWKVCVREVEMAGK